MNKEEEEEEEEEAINNVEKFVDTIMVILPKYSTKIPEYCIKEEDWLSIKRVLNYIDKLEKENNIKNKVIDNLYADIEYEYSGTNYLKSLDEYYEEAQDE